MDTAAWDQKDNDSNMIQRNSVNELYFGEVQELNSSTNFSNKTFDFAFFFHRQSYERKILLYNNGTTTAELCLMYVLRLSHWSSLSKSLQTYSTVIANAGRLPASVVTTGVTLVELEPIVFVPAHVQQRHTKGPFSFLDRPHRCYHMYECFYTTLKMSILWSLVYQSTR